MKKETFLLEDKINEVEAKFTKSGWIVVYEWIYKDGDSFLIFPCLVMENKFKEYKEKDDWIIEPGREGRPSIITTYSQGKESPSEYHKYGNEGIEPFLHSRTFRFDDGDDKYVDISEEFILYFNLYERSEDKQNRIYYFIEETGDLDEAIVITPQTVRVKLRYLIEYLSIRAMYLFLCFDFTRTTEQTLESIGVSEFDNRRTEKDFFYRYQVRNLLGMSIDKRDSWVRGKVYIHPKPKDEIVLHFEIDESKYESFITGYDDQGNEVLESCRKDSESAIKLTFFKKEVLNKYYNDPGRYEVDGWHIKSKFWSLKIDNMVEDYVPVFLDELRMLPHKEQLHWKQYNIPPQKGISHTYYQTMIEGNFVDYPESADLFFKSRYEEFNVQWEKKYGWRLYKYLAKEDEHYFTSLHLPTTNNVKAFCEQILAIVKLTIDRLNEAEIVKGLQLEENDKGITKFSKFLESKGLVLPQLITFLRNLQSLRSGLIAHSFSNSNKDCKAAMRYFGMDGKNYKEVAKNIFMKSIFTLNTLEKHLIPDSDYSKMLAQRNDEEVTD